MPDPTKLKTLEGAGYMLRACCGLCVHGEFKPGSDWGGCPKIPYKHDKHSAAAKPASVHKAGYCDEYELNPKKREDLERSGFDRFLG